MIVLLSERTDGPSHALSKQIMIGSTCQYLLQRYNYGST